MRSPALSCERLGLTGKLDLAEISGDTAVPVEYRKSWPRCSTASSQAVDEMLEEAPAPDQPEPWPTDRVQVGLQALLLEEAVYRVDAAILYCAS